MLKQQILDKFIAKEVSRKEVARMLTMHPNAVSRLKKRYEQEGISVLMPDKPGPKVGSRATNRTEVEIEDIVVAYGLKYVQLGPIPLGEKIGEERKIILDSVTIWRILKRRKVRYTVEYKRWKQEAILYCLDDPGQEIQLDGSYPYGRQRKIVMLDAIDDCSRWVDGRLYEREDADSAIDFVSQLVPRVPFRIRAIRVDNRYGKRFKVFCETLGVEVIENDPYTPKQNGKIERFHKTIKREFFWRYCSYHDSDELLKYKLSQWLVYYNTKRRHGGYGMNRRSPAQKLASTYLQALSFSYPQKVTLSLQQYTFFISMIYCTS